MEKPNASYVVREAIGPEVPLIVSIPHCGLYLPAEVERNLATDEMKRLPMTDWHLEHLYDFLPSLGVTTIYATYSRFFADVNRPPTSEPLYPGRFETGLVALKSFQGEDIYREPPDQDEIERRREECHTPYHRKLDELLRARAEKFGTVFLIDAHSIASKATVLHGRLRQEIYLGNRDWASCEDWLFDGVENEFEWFGLTVARNNPYKGGYITAHYGAMRDVQALQIEMVQRVYMKEDADPFGNVLNAPRFATMRARLGSVFSAAIKLIESHAESG